MSVTDISAEEAQLREAKIQEATAKGILVNDTALMFRKVVDRMPTTTWLLEAKRLINTEPTTKYEGSRQADAIEELDDLRKDLKTLITDWAADWYARGGIYVTAEGAVDEFRHCVESFAPALADLQWGDRNQAAPAEAMEEIRAAILPCSLLIIIELMRSAHFVVSDAMKYALFGEQPA